MEAHIGQHISQATEMQTLCWSKTRPSFSTIWRAYWEYLPHIFTGAFAILRYEDIHCTQTMYLAISRSTYYSIPYLNRPPFMPIYIARSNCYWSIIIWLAREFVEFNRAYVRVNCHFWKRGILASHMYMENIWSTPPPPPTSPGENIFGVSVTQDNDRTQINKRVYYYDNWSQNR